MASLRRALTSVYGNAPPPPKFRAAPAPDAPAAPVHPTALPSQYPPLLLLHALLLHASLFLLPQTPLPDQLFAQLPTEPVRGADHPQAAFLVPLTAFPVRTLSWSVLGSAALVAWWAGWVREWVRDGSMAGRGVVGRLKAQGELSETRGDAWKAWAFTIYTTLAYYVVLVLFGAPIATHLPHTALLASLLAILTVFIPAYALGPPVLPLPFLSQSTPSAAVVLNDTWVRVFAERKPHSAAERALLYPALGAVVGAWTGVIPIGLDWDRPWQAYPLTPAYGAALGYTIGALSALVVSGTVFLAAQDVDRTAEQVAVKNKNQKAKERKKRGKELKEA